MRNDLVTRLGSFFCTEAVGALRGGGRALVSCCTLESAGRRTLLLLAGENFGSGGWGVGCPGVFGGPLRGGEKSRRHS